MDTFLIFMLVVVVLVVGVSGLVGSLKKPKKSVARRDEPAVEVQFHSNGMARTKFIDIRTYNTLMELAKNPENGQLVSRMLEALE